MAKIRLDLKTREQFAALSLHEKNEYLQGVAQQIAHHQELPFLALDRDALSRLRRFYSRRAFADLRLDDARLDEGLRASLQSYAEAIHHGEIEKVVAHELPARAAKTNRTPPDDDAQLMFFVPTVHDAPVKDDVNLMDIAPFALSKTARDGILRYQLKDALVTVEGGAEVGLATAYDYDIFINMVSHLAAEFRDYRIKEERGLRPSLPPRVYAPAAAEIFKFCRREPGGKQYLDLEKALDRLQATRIKITNLNGGKRRETESFPLIGRYKVVSRTSMDRVDQLEIDIPQWVYEGVVNPQKTPTILTLNPDYFLIAKPMARFIYRLARKAAGSKPAEYGFPELHARSGSRLSLSKFSTALEDIVRTTREDPLPDFDLEIVPGKSGRLLRMSKREAAAIAALA